jgi:cytoskeleton protein RodZ
VDAVAPNDGQALLSPTPEAPEADPADMATLVFTFEGQSWMEVRDARGRDLLFELVAEPGRREVRGVPPFQLVIGDVEQVEVRYKGEPVDLNAYSRQGMARLELGGS